MRHSAPRAFQIQLHGTLTLVTIKQCLSFGLFPSFRGPAVLLASISDLVLLPAYLKPEAESAPETSYFLKIKTMNKVQKNGIVSESHSECLDG
jgi:hypothetical protein